MKNDELSDIMSRWPAWRRFAAARASVRWSPSHTVSFFFVKSANI